MAYLLLHSFLILSSHIASYPDHPPLLVTCSTKVWEGQLNLITYMHIFRTWWLSWLSRNTWKNTHGKFTGCWSIYVLFAALSAATIQYCPHTGVLVWPIQLYTVLFNLTMCLLWLSVCLSLKSTMYLWQLTIWPHPFLTLRECNSLWRYNYMTFSK